MNIYRVQFKHCGSATPIYWGVAENEHKAIEGAKLFVERVAGDHPDDLAFKLCELVEEVDFGPPGVGHPELYDVEDLDDAGARLARLKTDALTWSHHDDCAGHGAEDADGEEPAECDCGTGDVLRAAMPGCRVTVNRETGESIVVEDPK